MNDVETLPSGSVMRVEERVSQEGRTWEGCAMAKVVVGSQKEGVSRERVP